MDNATPESLDQCKDLPEKETCSIECKPGFELTGEATRGCNDGKFVGNAECKSSGMSVVVVLHFIGIDAIATTRSGTMSERLLKGTCQNDRECVAVLLF